VGGLQCLEAAVTATKSLDDKVLAQWLKKNRVDTIIGKLRFDGPNNYGDDLFRVKQVQDGKWVVCGPASSRRGRPAAPPDRIARVARDAEPHAARPVGRLRPAGGGLYACARAGPQSLVGPVAAGEPLALRPGPPRRVSHYQLGHAFHWRRGLAAGLIVPAFFASGVCSTSSRAVPRHEFTSLLVHLRLA